MPMLRAGLREEDSAMRFWWMLVVTSSGLYSCSAINFLLVAKAGVCSQPVQDTSFHSPPACLSTLLLVCAFHSQHKDSPSCSRQQHTQNLSSFCSKHKLAPVIPPTQTPMPHQTTWGLAGMLIPSASHLFTAVYPWSVKRETAHSSSWLAKD